MTFPRQFAMPSPNGTNHAGMYLPADRFPSLARRAAQAQAAYDSRTGLARDGALEPDLIERILRVVEGKLGDDDLEVLKALLEDPHSAMDSRKRMASDASPATLAEARFYSRFPNAARIGTAR